MGQELHEICFNEVPGNFWVNGLLLELILVRKTFEIEFGFFFGAIKDTTCRPKFGNKGSLERGGVASLAGPQSLEILV